MYPYSKDGVRYQRLIDLLSSYRLTLGQPRQEYIADTIFRNFDKDKTDFNKLLEGVDLNKLLEVDSVKKLVQAQSDRRVTQALATAKERWKAEQEEAQTEAQKLEKMTEAQKAKYKFEQERAQFEAEKAKFAHSQLVVETQKQMLKAGLPDLAEFVTGTTAEETTANLEKITSILSSWKSEQLNSAMRGTAPKDTNPGEKPRLLTAEEIRKMTPEEINAAWKAGRIDTSKL